MRMVLVRACVALGLVVLAFVFVTTPAQADTGSVVDIAHRGSSGEAPENTIAAVELALEQHVDFVEVDVQRSADGELILMHDVTLERTTDAEEVFPERAPWRVGDFTLEELRELDAGSWFDEEFVAETVPTLEEAVDVLGQRAGLLLEVKDPALYPGIEEDIDKELASIPGYMPAALATGNLVVQSFDHESMRRFHDRRPEVPIGLLYAHRPTEAELSAASGWAEQINTGHHDADEDLVARVHELDMTISVYTVNTTDLMRRYIDMGVDGIITDFPAELREVSGANT